MVSMYAASHILVMCSLIERSLSKIKPRLRTIPANVISVEPREIVGTARSC